MRRDDPWKLNPEIVSLKKRAKELQDKSPELINTHAIELAARERGFKTYAAFLAHVKGKGNEYSG